MKPADSSGKKLNRAKGAVTQSEKAAIEFGNELPKRKTPSSFDLRVFEHRIGLEDEDREDECLMRLRDAFGNFARALEDIHARERAIRADRTRTPDHHAIRLDKVAKESLEPVGKRGQRAVESAWSQCKAIDQQIESSLRSRLTPEERAEIRRHIFGLGTPEKRRELLAKADDDVISAVLSGKPFLSGLSSSQAERLRFEAENRLFPGLVKRRKKLEKAISQIADGWQRYMSEISVFTQNNANEIEDLSRKADAAVSSPISLDGDSEAA